MVIEFMAWGFAQPKGSTRAFMPKGARFPVVTSDNPKLKYWQQVVASAAQQQAGASLATGPVRLHLQFMLPRPKSLGTKTVAHTKRPDLDKLVRAVKDALKGVLYDDDSQVIALWATKAYAPKGVTPNVRVRLEDFPISGSFNFQEAYDGKA